MLATAMDKANSELGLTSFKTTEEYLALDDYTVWSALKKCKASSEIIGNLEQRRMLKCAYERTFYEKDAMISSLFGRETYRLQIQSEIAKEANVELESVIIDVPTVPPYLITTPSLWNQQRYQYSPRGKRVKKNSSDSAKVQRFLKP